MPAARRSSAPVFAQSIVPAGALPLFKIETNCACCVFHGEWAGSRAGRRISDYLCYTLCRDGSLWSKRPHPVPIIWTKIVRARTFSLLQASNRCVCREAAWNGLAREEGEGRESGRFVSSVFQSSYEGGQITVEGVRGSFEWRRTPVQGLPDRGMGSRGTSFAPLIQRRMGFFPKGNPEGRHSGRRLTTCRTTGIRQFGS